MRDGVRDADIDGESVGESDRDFSWLGECDAVLDVELVGVALLVGDSENVPEEEFWSDNESECVGVSEWVTDSDRSGEIEADGVALVLLVGD